jgi:hypothetical protein
MSRAREFQLVTDDDTPEVDSEAEDQLLAAFATTRAREKTEVAAVEFQRYQNTPQRDAGGKLTRDGNGKTLLGPLVLYFRRLEPGTLISMRAEYTVRTPVRRGGRTQYEDKFDDEGFALHIAYIAMMPWCRAMYFDNQRLWGDEPVGTGEEFLRQRLNLGEVGYCLEAVQELEGLGEERRDQMGKSSKGTVDSTFG